MKKFLMTTVLIILLGTACSSETNNKQVLDVPYYSQKRDQVWAEELLGNESQVTINTHGCALTSSAMVLSFYDIDFNPSTLNKYLKRNDGFMAAYDGNEYLGDIILMWNALLETNTSLEHHDFYNWRDTKANLDIIKNALNENHPVIAEVRWRGAPHYVVITGYDGDILYMNDPNQPNEKIVNDFYNLVSDKYGSGLERNIYSAHVIY